MCFIMQCKKDVQIGIYKVTSPEGKIYVGQSINISKRFSDYLQLNTKTKNQPLLWESFLKHTPSNHIFEVIEFCEKHELNSRERYWQEFYDVLNGGLNSLLQECPGKKRVLSETVKKQISENWKPRKITEEEREVMRDRMIGNKFSLGRVRPKSERDSISNTMKRLGIQSGDKNSMFGKYGEDNPNSKIILNTLTGIFYFGVKEASLFNNVSYSTLKKKLAKNGEYKSFLFYV